MNNSPESFSSLLLSSLGWILLVVLAGIFFFVAKPHYYRQGALDQFNHDVVLVNQALNLQTNEVDAIPGIVEKKLGGKLVISSTLRPTNPLLPAYPEQREVILSSDTQFKARRLKTDAELEADLEQRRATQSQEAVTPFVETQSSLDDLQEGDEVLIVPVESKDVGYLETLTAYQVIKNVTPTP